MNLSRFLGTNFLENLHFWMVLAFLLKLNLLKSSLAVVLRFLFQKYSLFRPFLCCCCSDLCWARFALFHLFLLFQRSFSLQKEDFRLKKGFHGHFHELPFDFLQHLFNVRRSLISGFLVFSFGSRVFWCTWQLYFRFCVVFRTQYTVSWWFKL